MRPKKDSRLCTGISNPVIVRLSISSSFIAGTFTQRALVFLGKENEEKGFSFYPVAKTGDFGLAVMTNPEDDKNPGEYVGHGTHGYFAPVRARNHADTNLANLSYRSNSTTYLRKSNDHCPPIPMSGLLAQQCSNY